MSEMNFEATVLGLIDDLAILTNGKTRYNMLDEYERQVYLESLSKFKTRGGNLIKERGLKKKLQFHKDEYARVQSELNGEETEVYKEKIV